MKWFKKYHLELLLVLPMTFYILGFTLLPLIRTIILGFQNRYTGKFSLSTYQALFARPDFLKSISNTFVIALLSLSIQIVIAFIIALVLKQRFHGRSIIRAIVLMPMGIPTIVSGIIALYVFGTSGYFNELLFKLHLITKPINWLTGNFKGLLIIALADMWKVLPTLVLLLLAGLDSISQDIYEAAELDGANSWQSFRFITLPLLKPTITMAVLLRAVDVFRIFELPQVLVGKSVPFVSTFAYEEYDIGDLNGSGAASTILLLMILVFAILWLKFVDRGGSFGNDS
ncbi:carbohydrate ABC transporter permease [Lapidilactobacillus gannanensis]|uniref:Carbohydrate ABC transporter permease n=1 Tax=Lapidilactobacillus gannanensis TaxID=2486002 RepID=A0ABW4BJZ4_9LACO|nr:sugar ABC transporter permease [Lapidilactobacillus gannanensis]